MRHKRTLNEDLQMMGLTEMLPKVVSVEPQTVESYIKMWGDSGYRIALVEAKTGDIIESDFDLKRYPQLLGEKVLVGGQIVGSRFSFKLHSGGLEGKRNLHEGRQVEVRAGTLTCFYCGAKTYTGDIDAIIACSNCCLPINRQLAESVELDALAEASAGKKLYYVQDNIGKAKYVVNFHDGIKTHDDGSPFYDVRTFRNRVERDQFVKELEARGYKKASSWEERHAQSEHNAQGEPVHEERGESGRLGLRMRDGAGPHSKTGRREPLIHRGGVAEVSHEEAIQAAQEVLDSVYSNFDDEIPDAIDAEIRKQCDALKRNKRLLYKLADEIEFAWGDNPSAEDLYAVFIADKEGDVSYEYFGCLDFWPGASYSQYPYRSFVSIPSSVAEADDFDGHERRLAFEKPKPDPDKLLLEKRRKIRQIRRRWMEARERTDRDQFFKPGMKKPEPKKQGDKEPKEPTKAFNEKNKVVEGIEKRGQFQRDSLGGWKRRYALREKSEADEPIAKINDSHYSLELEDGKYKYSLGNFSDSGWYWSGDSDDDTMLLFLYRLANSGVWNTDVKKQLLAFEGLSDYFKKIRNNENELKELAHAVAGDNVTFYFGHGFWDLFDDYEVDDVEAVEREVIADVVKELKKQVPSELSAFLDWASKADRNDWLYSIWSDAVNRHATERPNDKDEGVTIHGRLITEESFRRLRYGKKKRRGTKSVDLVKRVGEQVDLITDLKVLTEEKESKITKRMVEDFQAIINVVGKNLKYIVESENDEISDKKKSKAAKRLKNIEALKIQVGDVVSKLEGGDEVTVNDILPIISALIGVLEEYVEIAQDILDVVGGLEPTKPEKPVSDEPTTLTTTPGGQQQDVVGAMQGQAVTSPTARHGGVESRQYKDNLAETFPDEGFPLEKCGLVKIEKDGYYGLKNKDGEVIAKPIYQWIDDFVNANGMVQVRHRDGRSGAIEVFTGEEELQESAWKEISDNSGNLVLISYQTPVAARIGGKYYRTSKRYSVTTSKHINQWLRKYGAEGKAEVKPPEFFESLIKISHGEISTPTNDSQGSDGMEHSSEISLGEAIEGCPSFIKKKDSSTLLFRSRRGVHEVSAKDLVDYLVTERNNTSGISKLGSIEGKSSLIANLYHSLLEAFKKVNARQLVQECQRRGLKSVFAENLDEAK